MSSAYCPPCCLSPVATRSLRTLLAAASVAFVWAAAALHPLCAGESDTYFFGPARHAQTPQAVQHCANEAQELQRQMRIANKNQQCAPLPRSGPRPLTRISSKWQTQLIAKNEAIATDQGGNTNSNPETLTLPEPSSAVVTDRSTQDPTAKRTTIDQQPQQTSCFVAAPMSTLTTDISLPAGQLPGDAAARCASVIHSTGDPRLSGGWAETRHHWAASGFYHQPLYFEEVNAERYGYTLCECLQPVISAAWFHFNLAALPYKLAVEQPWDCIYSLGHYRPGSCAPRRWHHLPCQACAVAAQTGTIAALILIIP